MYIFEKKGLGAVSDFCSFLSPSETAPGMVYTYVVRLKVHHCELSLAGTLTEIFQFNAYGMAYIHLDIKDFFLKIEIITSETFPYQNQTYKLNLSYPTLSCIALVVLMILL